MSALPNAIPHDVETKTHLVAVPPRVERQGEEGCASSILSIGFSLSELRNLPNHCAIMVAVFDQREPKIMFFKLSVQQLNFFL